MTLMWFNGTLRVLVLPVLLLFGPVFVEAWWIACVAGLGIYSMTILYLRMLHVLDTSVTQSAWAIEAIFLSILGILVLGEQWTIPQTIGSVLILSGVLFLSYWHAHVSVRHTLGLLLLLGGLSAPFSVLFKIALDTGMALPVGLFWYVGGSTLAAVITPVFRHSERDAIRNRISSATAGFMGCVVLAFALAAAGFTTMTMAMMQGPLSLVGVSFNAQPFFVILFSWLLQTTGLRHLPKELLSRQSIRVKFLSFTLVVCGLTLLTV